MTVYVDSMRARFGRMVMCHMLADTHEELVEMARKIGLRSEWIQAPGTEREHFDVSLSKRKLAISNGAAEVSRDVIAELIAEKRSLSALSSAQKTEES